MKKTYKLNYYSKALWRRLFFYKQNRILKYEERFFLTRSASISKTLLNTKLYIYDGINWTPRYINKWMVGYPLGAFTWNRKVALYKAKQLKKKKK